MNHDDYLADAVEREMSEDGLTEGERWSQRERDRREYYQEMDDDARECCADE